MRSLKASAMYSDDEANSGSSDDVSSGRSGGEGDSDSDTAVPQEGATGLTGNKNCRKHTRQFIEHVVARATDTYEGEELGR
jgi:hypothetical protein